MVDGGMKGSERGHGVDRLLDKKISRTEVFMALLGIYVGTTNIILTHHTSLSSLLAPPVNSLLVIMQAVSAMHMASSSWTCVKCQSVFEVCLIS